MSGVTKPSRVGIKRAGNVEYAYAINHSHTQIKCFFCKKWHHSAAPGNPIEPGNGCIARAARFKHVVLTARTDNSGVRASPSNGEVQQAIKHAVKHG